MSTNTVSYPQVDLNDYYNDFDDVYFKLYDETNAVDRTSDGPQRNLLRANIMKKMAAQEEYILEQLKQHEQITQYLTYANELYRTEKTLSSFMGREQESTKKTETKLRNNVYKARQRYLNRSYYIYWYSFYMFFMQMTIITLLTCGILMSFFVRGIIGPAAYYILLIVTLAVYTIWAGFFYFREHYKRNRTASTRYDFDVRDKDKDSCPS